MTQSIWTRLDTLTPQQHAELNEKLRVTFQEVLVARLARAGVSQGELAARVGRTSPWTTKVKKLEAYDMISMTTFSTGLGIKPSDILAVAEEVIDAEIDRGIFKLSSADDDNGQQKL